MVVKDSVICICYSPPDEVIAVVADKRPVSASLVTVTVTSIVIAS